MNEGYLFFLQTMCCATNRESVRLHSTLRRGLDYSPPSKPKAGWQQVLIRLPINFSPVSSECYTKRLSVEYQLTLTHLT